MTKRKQSISSLVGVVIIVMTTVVVATHGFIQYRSVQKMMKAQLRTRLKIYADQLSSSLSLPLWNFDNAQIDEIVNGVMKDNSVYGMIVTDSSGKEIRALSRNDRWEIVPGAVNRDAQGLLVEERTISVPGSNIGALKLYGTSKFTYQELRRSLVSTIFIICVMAFILIMFLYFLMRRIVLSPLEEIERYAMARSGGDWTPMKGIVFRGELRSLRDSIEKMVDMLNARYSDLQERERQYRTLFENAGDAIFIMKGERIIDCNLKALEMFGADRADIIDSSPAKFSPEIQTDGSLTVVRVAERINFALSGEAQSFEWRHKKLNGELFDAEVTLSLLELTSGKHLLAIVRNIDERKKAERVFREKDILVQTINNSLVNGFVFQGIRDDMNTVRFTYFSDRITELLGITPEEGLADANKVYDRFHPEDRNRLLNNAIAMFENLDAFSDEVRGYNNNGEERWFYISAYPIRQKNGGVLNNGIVFDITDRKIAERELKESEEKYRALVDNALVGFGISEGLQTTFMNKALRDIYCYGENEPLDIKPLVEYITPETRHVVNDYREKMARGEPLPKVLEHDIIRRDGQKRTIMFAPIMVDKEKQLAYTTFIDVTEQRKSEKEKEKTLFIQQGISMILYSLLEREPIERKLKKITDGIVSIFRADFCRIWLIKKGDLCDQDCAHAKETDGPHACRFRDKCLHLIASSGRYTHTDGAVHRRVPFGCYKIGEIASGNSRKIITNDVRNSTRIHDREWAQELGLESFAGYQMSVPGGESIGVMGLFSKSPILELEEMFLESLSSAAAIIVQQCVAQEAEDESKKQLSLLSRRLISAQENERRLLSRELHDELGQKLTGLNLEIATLKRKPEKIENFMMSSRSILNDMREQLSNICNGLRPVIVDKLGLKQALQTLLEEFGERLKISVEADIDDIPKDCIDSDLAICIYRLTQELTTNISKHSKADKVTIELKNEGDKISLKVEDNGVGFDEKNMTGRISFGILGMRERTKQHGGEFEIQSSPGLGAITRVIFPVQGNQEE